MGMIYVKRSVKDQRYKLKKTEQKKCHVKKRRVL